MREKLLLPKVMLSVTLGLGMTACAESAPDEPETVPTNVDVDDYSRSVRYLEDGSRLISFTGEFRTIEGQREFPLDVLQFCEAGDLFEQSLGQYGYPAGGINRTLDYEACADGMLTESDFTSK